jgi:hypothetical protein
VRLVCRAAPDKDSPKRTIFVRRDEDDDGVLDLQPDEDWDWEVPGSSTSTLSKNTELGQAVDKACDEMEHLRGLENDVLERAQAVLSKAGYRKSLFDNSERRTDAANSGAQQ